MVSRPWFTHGDLKRLLRNFNRLFPGARFVNTREDTTQPQSKTDLFIAFLRRDDLPSPLSTTAIGQHFHDDWRVFGKNIMRSAEARQAIADAGWEYQPGKGRRAGCFTRINLPANPCAASGTLVQQQCTQSPSLSFAL